MTTKYNTSTKLERAQEQSSVERQRGIFPQKYGSVGPRWTDAENDVARILEVRRSSMNKKSTHVEVSIIESR